MNPAPAGLHALVCLTPTLCVYQELCPVTMLTRLPIEIISTVIKQVRLDRSNPLPIGQ